MPTKQKKVLPSLLGDEEQKMKARQPTNIVDVLRGAISTDQTNEGQRQFGQNPPPALEQNQDSVNYGFGRVMDANTQTNTPLTTLQPNISQAMTPNVGQPQQQTQPITQAPPPLTPYEQKQKDLADIITAPQSKAKTSTKLAYTALQVLGKVFNPQDQSPIDFDLDGTRKQGRIAQAQRELAPLQAIEQQKINSQIAQTKAQGELYDTQNKGLAVQKTLGELSGQQIKNINDRVKPYLDTLQAQKRITPEQADYLSRMTGMQWDAAQWSAYKDTQINGKTYSRREDTPVYQENQTVPIDTGGTWNNVNIGGATNIPVQTKALAPLITANENNNANRSQNQSQFETRTNLDIEKTNASNDIEVQKTNAANAMRYNDKVTELQQQIAATGAGELANAGELQGVASQMDSIAKEMQALSSGGSGIDEETANKRIGQLNDEFRKLQGQMQTGLGRSARGQEILKSLKNVNIAAPAKITAPRVGKNLAPKTRPKLQKSYTKAEVTQRLQSRGLSGTALNNALKQAQKDGVF